MIDQREIWISMGAYIHSRLQAENGELCQHRYNDEWKRCIGQGPLHMMGWLLLQGVLKCLLI